MKHTLDFSLTSDGARQIRQRIALDALLAQRWQEAQQPFPQLEFGPTVRPPAPDQTAPLDYRPVANAVPVLERRDADFNQLPFPKELWTLVLKNLDEASLPQSMQACRGLYHLGWGLELNRLDPFSGLGRLQQKRCSDKLNAIIQAFRDVDDPEESPGEEEVERLVKSFEQELHSFATRYRCVQVSFVHGFEEAAINALAAAPRWQSLALSLKDAQPSDACMIAELERALEAKGRRADISLVLPWSSLTDAEWSKVLPTGSALRLTGISLVDRPQRTQPRVLELLKSDNALEYLAVSVGSDALFQAVRIGSRRLAQLVISNSSQINDFPGLLSMLRAQDRLRCLHYGYGRLGKNSVTIADLLSASPHLEEMYLPCCTIGVDASQGSHAALKNSKLRVIGLSDCSLESDGTNPNSNLHAELRKGLREAPALETLDLSSVSNDFPESAAFFVSAFAGNPSAKFLRVIRVDAEQFSRWEMCRLSHNALREEQGWAPISLQEPPPSMEKNWWDD